jgi:hypothetical protein
MAANIDPVFGRKANTQWVSLINAAANTATDGTGTVFTAFTANADAGDFVQYLLIKPVNATGSNNVTNVLRVFLNNGSTNATAANNSFIGEVSLPATTGSNSAPQVDIAFAINRVLDPNYKINVCVGTATGAALGWYVTTIATSLSDL